MKPALMSVSKGVEGKINIGDFIQILAASQYMPRTDCYLERETELANYKGEDVAMIMNGWYMCHPENWPPSSKIHPLFIAFHINDFWADKMLSKESVNYLRSQQPIGCRDTNTVDLLKKKGIDAYFSGCLTLTLGKKYYSRKKDNKVYIVDVCQMDDISYIKHNLRVFARTIVTLLSHSQNIICITKKKGQFSIDNLLLNSYNYLCYSKIFDGKLLAEAEYINHYNYEIHKKYPTPSDKLSYAESLVQKYAKASCVITSRIHCALPCLGLGTKVIFIDNEWDGPSSTCRFGGLKELFNVVTWKGGALSNPLTKGLISKKNFPENKTTWKELADSLDVTCTTFSNNYCK